MKQELYSFITSDTFFKHSLEKQNCSHQICYCKTWLGLLSSMAVFPLDLFLEGVERPQIFYVFLNSNLQTKPIGRPPLLNGSVKCNLTRLDVEKGISCLASNQKGETACSNDMVIEKKQTFSHFKEQSFLKKSHRQ